MIRVRLQITCFVLLAVSWLTTSCMSNKREAFDFYRETQSRFVALCGSRSCEPCENADIFLHRAKIGIVKEDWALVRGFVKRASEELEKGQCPRGAVLSQDVSSSERAPSVSARQDSTDGFALETIRGRGVQTQDGVHENRLEKGKKKDVVERYENVVIRNGYVENSNPVWFSAHESALEPASLRILSEIALALKADPRLSITVLVSSDDYASASKNLELSTQRGNYIVRVLIEKGVNPSQLHSDLLKESKGSEVRLKVTRY